VVELKDDADASDENRAKFRYATEHFERINARQSGHATSGGLPTRHAGTRTRLTQRPRQT
jgi:hypothetical protein